MRSYSQGRARPITRGDAVRRVVLGSPQVQDLPLALMCVIAFGEPRTNLRESIRQLPELFLKP